MKKLFSMMLVMAVFFGFSTNAFAAAGDRQFEQGLEIIKNANVAIDAKIAVAVDQADVLQKDYIAKVRSIEQSEISKLQQEKASLTAAVQSNSYSNADVIEMNKKIEEIDGKILAISQQLETNIVLISQEIEAFMSTVGPEVTPTNEELYVAIENLASNLNKKSNRYISATDVYTKKLNFVIQDCYNVTLTMSNDARAKAYNKGVIAECSWKLVRFGHLWVWIDPIKVVGRH